MKAETKKKLQELFSYINDYHTPDGRLEAAIMEIEQELGLEDYNAAVKGEQE